MTIKANTLKEEKAMCFDRCPECLFPGSHQICAANRFWKHLRAQELLQHSVLRRAVMSTFRGVDWWYPLLCRSSQDMTDTLQHVLTVADRDEDVIQMLFKLQNRMDFALTFACICDQCKDCCGYWHGYGIHPLIVACSQKIIFMKTMPDITQKNTVRRGRTTKTSRYLYTIDQARHSHLYPIHNLILKTLHYVE